LDEYNTFTEKTSNRKSKNILEKVEEGVLLR
jgi:hypothetical protein